MSSQATNAALTVSPAGPVGCVAATNKGTSSRTSRSKTAGRGTGARRSTLPTHAVTDLSPRDPAARPATTTDVNHHASRGRLRTDITRATPASSHAWR